MQRLLLGAAVLLAVPYHAAGQGQPSPSAKHLEPFAFQVGTWVGEGEMPGFGKFSDEFKFTWVHNKNFLQHDYVMRVQGKEVWRDTGMLGWDADKKKLVTFGFGMDGSIGYGEAVESAEKDTWVMSGKTSGASPFKEWQTTIKKVDDRTMLATTAVRKGDKYVPLATIKYTKKAEK